MRSKIIEHIYEDKSVFEDMLLYTLENIADVRECELLASEAMGIYDPYEDDYEGLTAQDIEDSMQNAAEDAEEWQRDYENNEAEANEIIRARDEAIEELLGYIYKKEGETNG